MRWLDVGGDEFLPSDLLCVSQEAFDNEGRVHGGARSVRGEKLCRGESRRTGDLHRAALWIHVSQ